MRRSFGVVVCLLLVCFAQVGNALAEEAYPEKIASKEVTSANIAATEAEIRKTRGTLVLYFENDLFYDTDRYYTNAVQARYITPPLRSLSENDLLPDALDMFMDGAQNLQHSGSTQYNISIGFGQVLYTPEDTDTTVLQKDDRPYAAHLYGFFALHAKQDMMMDTTELTLGMVGPSAQGETAQNEVHRMRGMETSKGWNNQLRDEPTAMLTWTRNYRLNSDAGAAGWGWDILPYHSLTAGNVLTQAAVGGEMRYGWNLPRDFGTSLIRPGASIDAPTDNPALQRNDDEFGWYLFAGTEGRAVARNMFLDGNTWRSSHHVTKNNFVGELNGGVAFLISGMRVAYNHVYVTKEFTKQNGGQNYGSISLAVPF